MSDGNQLAKIAEYLMRIQHFENMQANGWRPGTNSLVDHLMILPAMQWDVNAAVEAYREGFGKVLKIRGEFNKETFLQYWHNELDQDQEQSPQEFAKSYFGYEDVQEPVPSPGGPAP